MSSLEGLFAKRLNICNPTECNVWLRKRLIEEYSLQPTFELKDMIGSIAEKFTNTLYQKECAAAAKYIGVVVRLPWQQQTGPSCGISALNMVNGALSKNEKSAVENASAPCEVCTHNTEKWKDNMGELDKLTPLTLAIRSGVSNDGELFCAYNLSYVACQSLGLNLMVTELSASKAILNEILAGRPVLIPYDRDLSNHGPSMAEGGQAHWAAVIGVITPCDNGDFDNGTSALLEIPEVVSKLYILDATNSLGSNSACILTKTVRTDDVVYLICMHGMSQKPFVCTFNDMMQSNAQLQRSKSKFYMASEDLVHLRGKVLFVMN